MERVFLVIPGIALFNWLLWQMLFFYAEKKYHEQLPQLVQPDLFASSPLIIEMNLPEVKAKLIPFLLQKYEIDYFDSGETQFVCLFSMVFQPYSITNTQLFYGQLVINSKNQTQCELKAKIYNKLARGNPPDYVEKQLMSSLALLFDKF
jgi:hypothetical protein